MIEVSVVICFRDWGLDRLALALRSHAASTMRKELEVIVSDYGSKDAESVRRIVKTHGGVYIRTEVDGPWSRSRALNAGIAHARGGMVITTDADMLFTPEAHNLIREHLLADPHSVQLLQCRDLLPVFSASAIDQFEWGDYEKNSILRPRWGMGGMVAFPVSAYEYIRGYDERMEIYGGEDIDFAQRMRRAGHRLNWIDDPSCRIFHVWHESSRKSADETIEGRVAIERNRDITMNDRTWVRNLSWRHSRPAARPLATVSIATYNRAEFLGDCLQSVLSQPIQDIEIVVVDDGSRDHTESVVKSFGDDRIRYIYQENQGVSVARNRALAESRAPFIVIQDDDDIMLPWRIQAHFDALSEGCHGTYGGWVDFENRTGELVARHGKEFGLAQMLYSGRVMAHGTLMMRADMLKKFGYNPALRAGTDFNLAIRMTMAGVKLRHSGEFHILRRFHDSNLTNTISDHQKDSARKTTNLYRRRFSAAKEVELRQQARAVEFMACHDDDDLFRKVGRYLPDRLVHRVASIQASDARGLEAIKEFAESQALACEVFKAIDHDGALVDRQVCIFGINAWQLHDLRQLGFAVDLDVESSQGRGTASIPATREVVERIVDTMTETNAYYCVLAAPSESAAASELWASGANTRRLVVVGRRQYAVATTRFDTIDEVAAYAEMMRDRAPEVACLMLQPTI